MFSGYHYPARLLLAQIMVLALLELLELLASKCSQRTRSDWDIAQSSGTDESTALCSTQMLTQMFCIAGALICEYQAVLHFSTLPALVMLLSIDFPQVIFGYEGWYRRITATTISLIGMALICINEKSLTRQGIIMVAMSMALRALAAGTGMWRTSIHEEQGMVTHPWRTFGVILVTILLALDMVRRFESPIYTPIDIRSNIASFVLALSAGAVVLRSEFSLFAAPKSPNQQLTKYFGEELAITPVTLVILTALGVIFTGARSAMTTWQYVGFAMCIWGEWTVLPRQRKQEEDHQTLPSTDSVKSGMRSDYQQYEASDGTPKVLLTLLCGFAIAMYLTLESSTAEAGLYAPTMTVGRNSSFDFVISRYAEPAEAVARQLESIIQLEPFRGCSIRAIVYDASGNQTSSFERVLQEALGPRVQLSMPNRENVGREGAAYLHHMESSYDQLADHTLFTQATPHDPRYLRHRLDDYLVQQTGFLPLSQVREYCSDCDACWDHSTWSESRDVLEEVLEQPCNGFALTYRGQFVASRSSFRLHFGAHVGGLDGMC
ncbi:hypothetical protein Slin14017_G041950 [Septoria linicola]|nr:hypothetical protein Slin14017_G041950 [Septoria linicola]